MSDTLAIAGGKPVRSRPLPYARQWVDEDDIRAVAEVLRGDWLTTGPAVGEYERAFAAYVGAKRAVAVSSGTAALHAAVFAAGIQPGDEVITSPLTFVASANCVLYCGGSPVFADVQADTGNLDASDVEAFITDRTRAILAVDYGGQPADLEELRTIAARHGLRFIEDAAHALGATYKGQRVGALADLTAFSTHPVKHIATGEGGVITTEDDGVADRLRAFRNHGIRTDAHMRAERGDWFYDMEALGFNYRISDILCALGRQQLSKADLWLARRRAIAARYQAAFAEMPEIETPVERADREHAWHLYTIRLNFDRLDANRRQIFVALRAEGILVNVHYIPVYWHPYYQRLGYRKGLCRVAESLYERLITLPLWPGMTDADADDVICAVNKVIDAYRQ